MDLQQRINAFATLGRFLSQFSSKIPSKDETVPHNDPFFKEMPSIISKAAAHNGWFTSDSLTLTFKNWAEALSEDNLDRWMRSYTIPEEEPKTIAVVMAGNIPLVGLHDFLSVLITGNSVLAKLSSNDKVVLPFLADYLMNIEPGFKNRIAFTEGRITEFNAVIATGSNNTAKHFEFYFREYPHIIRKNRNSVAVLSGKETHEELIALSDDIFQYFGLGCRNVSKLFVPKGYDFDLFFQSMYAKKDFINNHKYINNYDYNKAVYLMSDVNLLDNEFLLLKEDSSYSSPISVLYYEYYENLDMLQKKLNEDSDEIQAIVSTTGIKNELSFGNAQNPALWDYADGVDTVQFLIRLD